jgi:hypothetical protein
VCSSNKTSKLHKTQPPLSATAAHPTASPLPRRTTHSPPPAPHRHLTQHLSPAATRLPTPSLGMQSSYLPIPRLPHKPPRAPPRKSRSAPIARAHDLEQDPSHRPRNLPEQKGQAAAVARTPARRCRGFAGRSSSVHQPTDRASERCASGEENHGHVEIVKRIVDDARR